jgi:hypothetical protein
LSILATSDIQKNQGATNAGVFDGTGDELHFEPLHPSVERRRRRLVVVVRTERLLLHGVEAVRERLEELPILCGKTVGELRDLHLTLQQLLDGGGVLVVAVDVVASPLPGSEL